MKKSIFAVLMASVMLLCTACGPNSTSSSAKDSSSTSKSEALKPIKKEDLKVGFVYIGTINDEGYTQAQDKGRLALEEMGIKTMYSESVPENSDCETAIRNLIDQGCNVIYSTSFGFGEWTAKVAKDY
ncbi:MAG TPA: BMP family ABC transporter substrate-binding protein, partial [Oscillospiraceae bacterium]|nr:BMP family ABC transporter substrate-binding protein [Oscillospiraceae bacterium]